ncbi:MAG TPA: metalloregulator ArsR/SmtB family transcription factor [Casimicrobiaceae bacterium]|nr:metalloregulator ArsR/SmtB family transcription factor [Casimicrobiaceae bacterium]
MKTMKVLAALGALSQEHRLAIFRQLVEYGPDGLTAGTIAERLKLPPATLSFHLKELSAAGLILSRQESRFIWYRADFDTMIGLVAYLTENCCRSSAACETSCVPVITRKPIAPKRSAPTRRSS